MSSRELSVHTEHEFLLKMEKAGLDEEQAQAVIESGKNKLAQELVDLIRSHLGPIADDWASVVVDYSRFTLADMIAACRYKSVDRRITTERFPVKGEGRVELNMAILHFGKAMTTKNVIAGLEHSSFRPAKIEELLTLCKERPGLQAKFSIVALGSVWNDSSGMPQFVASLNTNLVSTSASAGTLWADPYRFAAVKKENS